MENNQNTNPAVGRVYCRRLKEVIAVQVRRDNEAELRQFVGGGQLVIPRSINGVAVFVYGNGVSVKEGDYIMMSEDGLSYSVRRYEFEAEFEPKDAINSNINDVKNAGKPAECCGNCKHFVNEDADGAGFCYLRGRSSNCGDSACDRWVNGIGR